MEEVATFIFRFISYVLSEIIFGTFFYWLGWPFVKLATLGKYHKKYGKKIPERKYMFVVWEYWLSSSLSWRNFGSSAYNNMYMDSPHKW